MYRWTLSSFTQIMTWHLIGAKPSSKAMLVYSYLIISSSEIVMQIWAFLLKKINLNCHLQGPIMGEWVRSVGAKFRYLNIYFQFPICKSTIPWASYQIRKLWFAHAPGIPGTFFSPPTSKETASKRSWHASRHVLHARAVMHFRIANPRGKRSQHFRRMHNPQLSVSGERPTPEADQNLFWSGLGRSQPEKNNYWTPL